MPVLNEVISLWKKLLKLEKLQANESFFDLGGNSILCIQMLVMVTKIYEKELDFEVFFESPCAQTLAGLIQKC